MKKSIICAVFILATASQAIAQGAVPKLPDYGKLEPNDMHDEEAFYKGKEIALLHEDYVISDFKNERESATIIFYKPLGEKEIESKLARGNEKIRFLKQLGFDPWLLIYMPNIPLYGDEKINFYFFEYTRKPAEFYRLWKPKWRFVGVFEAIEQGENEKFQQMLEKRYRLRMPGY